MSMTFYDCASAPSPRRVRIFMAEKGLDIPTVQIDLASGEQLSESFLKINPYATVPVLSFGEGENLTEVNAICLYLEEKYPDVPLLGENAEQRARTWMWNTRIEQQFLAAIAESFRNHTRGMKGRALPGPQGLEQISQLVPRGRIRAEYFMGVLNERLTGHEFIAGATFSMADITALVAVDFAARIKLPVPAEYDALTRWHKSVAARESAKA